MFTLTIGAETTRTYSRKHDAQRVARKALERDADVQVTVTDEAGTIVWSENLPAADADRPVAAQTEADSEPSEAGQQVDVPAPVEDDAPAVELTGDVVNVTEPVPADQVPPAPARRRGRKFEITDTNLMVAKPFTLTDWELDGDFLKVTTAPLSTDSRMLKVTVEGEDIDGAILRGPGGYWRSVQFTEGVDPEVGGKCNNREIAVRDLLTRTGFRA